MRKTKRSARYNHMSQVNSHRSTIMVFGTFDILHAGHESLFEQTKKLGNYVIAVIARDVTVEKIKGIKPLYSENKRAKNLKSKKWADRVILGGLKDKYQMIKKFRPDVIALGYDQFAFTYRLEKFIIDEKMNTRVQRLDAYQPEIYKSSLIRDSWITRIKEKITIGVAKEPALTHN